MRTTCSTYGPASKARIGTLTLWGKNVQDEKYNDEFSYPFVWKGQPATLGRHVHEELLNSGG